MSSDQTTSNPLLGDPSIIQVFKEDGSNNEKSSHVSSQAASSGSVEPGSALSKLLDSAIAKAAEESTPEFEPRSRSNSPNTTMPTISKLSKKSLERVYTIEFLFELRNLPFVKDYKETNELPDKSFWRAKSKSQNTSSGAKDFGHNSKHGNNNNNNKNKNASNKKRQDSASNWERKPGFLKTGDLDSLSEDKISQLLGEPTEEIEPEWESADLNNELNLNMGQTVEDFEKWKSNMRSEERRRNGEIVEDNTDLNAEKSGNEVDYFFSFVKPKTQSVDSNASSLKAPSSGVSTPTVANSEPSAKSSRFSSFFNTPSSEKQPQLTRPDHGQSQNLPAQHQTQGRSQSHALPGKGDQGYSRFLSMMNNPNEANKPSPQSLPQPLPQPLPQTLPQPLPQTLPQPISPQKEILQEAKKPIPGQPLNDDTFFMSLLNKREGPDGSNTSSPALFASTIQGQPKTKVASPDIKQSPLTSNVQPQMQLQQIPGPKQQNMNLPPGQQINQQQIPPQQMPPWMRQFHGGPNVPPGVNGPNDSRPLGAPPTGANGHNQPPPHLQYPPNMGPPPKMFPPGFMPPPGMPMPSQFANGRNGPMPPPPGNHPYMGFPPGMPPPPPGMGMPPLQQSSGFDQRNQPSPRR